jgi:hypothetical protein
MIFVGVGLFYMDGPTLRFQGDDQEGEFDLSPFEGAEVKSVAFHMALPHRPSDQRGFGSCFWRGDCPFEHHLSPHRMLTFDQSGVVNREGSIWKIGEHLFPFDALPGHRCLVAVAPAKIEPSPSGGVSLEDLSALRTALDRLKVR